MDADIRLAPIIIRPGEALCHRECLLDEVEIAGPHDLLVRIGWPSRLIKGGG